MAKNKVPSSTVTRSAAVFGYVRVSTSDQADNGISLEEQQRPIEGRCLEQGWRLAEMFVERGVSGSVPFADRPEGGRLLQQLQAGDVVVSPKLDRVFRSSLDALQTIQQLKERRVSLWLLDLGGDVSGNGISEMIMTILAAVAQFERVRIGERIRDARAHMRRQGRHLGGTRPFGFQIVPGEGKPMLVPVASEQEAILQMRAMRRDGKKLREIRDAVHERGFNVSRETVRQLITRGGGTPPGWPDDAAGGPQVPA
jgi:putative DNA-invertase from lambdoid prophage Rac